VHQKVPLLMQVQRLLHQKLELQKPEPQKEKPLLSMLPQRVLQ